MVSYVDTSDWETQRPQPTLSPTQKEQELIDARQEIERLRRLKPTPEQQSDLEELHKIRQCVPDEYKYRLSSYVELLLKERSSPRDVRRKIEYSLESNSEQERGNNTTESDTDEGTPSTTSSPGSPSVSLSPSLSLSTVSSVTSSSSSTTSPIPFALGTTPVSMLGMHCLPNLPTDKCAGKGRPSDKCGFPGCGIVVADGGQCDCCNKRFHLDRHQFLAQCEDGENKPWLCDQCLNGHLLSPSSIVGDPIVTPRKVPRKRAATDSQERPNSSSTKRSKAEEGERAG
jgi:hypothetical protein